ncbi:hypothetical protein NX783_00605 [Massilia kyonggiensis]|nr:hypothetical protein [Massilia kyonggiensis]
MAIFQDTSGARFDLVRRPSWVVPARGRWQGVSACAIVLAEDTGRVLVRQCAGVDGVGLEWATWTADVLAGQSPLQVAINTIVERCAYDGDLALSRLTPFFDARFFVQHNYVAVAPQEFAPRIGDGCAGYQWCDLDQLPQPLSPALAHLLDRSGSDVRAMADLYKGLHGLVDTFDPLRFED